MTRPLPSMMTVLAVLSLLSARALAQAVPPPPAAPEPQPEAVEVQLPASELEREGAPVPVEHARKLSPRFLSQFLSYDDATGVARQGREKRVLTRPELYRTLGREDLAEQLGTLQRRRRALIISGVALGVAGAAGAVALFATAPNKNAGHCQRDVQAYNTCVSQDDVHHELAVASLVVAVLGVAGLVTTGIFTPAAPVSAGEESRLAHEYNAKLLESSREVRSEQPSPAPVQLAVTPYGDAEGGGVLVAGRF